MMEITMSDDLEKRHEYKLPLANWLRDQVNDVLARYDIHPDAYERDVMIDAMCVVAVDKIEAALTQPQKVRKNE
jgi:hypothetical protein